MKKLLLIPFFLILPLTAQAGYEGYSHEYADPTSGFSESYASPTSDSTAVILLLAGGGDRINSMTVDSNAATFINKVSVGSSVGYVYCYENAPTSAANYTVGASSGGDFIEMFIAIYSDYTCDTFQTQSGSGSVSNTTTDLAVYGARDASLGPPSSVTSGTQLLAGTQQRFADGTTVAFSGIGSEVMYGVTLVPVDPPPTPPAGDYTITPETSYVDAYTYYLNMVYIGVILGLFYVGLFSWLRW